MSRMAGDGNDWTHREEVSCGYRCPVCEISLNETNSDHRRSCTRPELNLAQSKAEANERAKNPATVTHWADGTITYTGHGYDKQ